MKIYILTKCKRIESTDEVYVWSAGYPTRREAVEAMHDEYLDDMKLSYGELDMPYIRERWRLAIRRGGEMHDAMEIETDFSATYDIFPDEL